MTQRSPFPPVSARYGAPMGRFSRNLHLDRHLDPPTSIAISGPQGEYDAGGAYWGISHSEGPVWAIWRKNKIREGVAYVRARSRADALAAAYDN